MGHLLKILTQVPAEDFDHATSYFNHFEESIRSYEE